VLLGAIALPYVFQPELFLAPAGKVTVRLTDVALPHIRDALGKGGLSGRDVLFVVGALTALALAFSWRRAPWLRRWLVAGAALAQLAITTYAFLAIDGRVADGAVARTGPPSLQTRAWIDNLPGGGGDVTIIRNAVWADFGLVINTLRDDAFYNDAVRWRAGIGATGLPFEQTPVDALPLFDNSVRPSDGRLEPGVPTRRALVWPGSPIFQLHGRRIADDPLGRPFELDELDQPARASWLALGLRGDGAVLDGPPVKLSAWPKGGAIVRVDVAPPPGGDGVVRFRFGGRAGNVRLGESSAVIPVRLKACGPTTGSIRAVKSVRQQDGSRVGAVLRSVTIEPAGNACPR
jgi:hypothetical protein